MQYVIAHSRGNFDQMVEELKNSTGQCFTLISQKSELTVDRLAEIRPRYVFFPHWSHIIPREIYERFECIIFHMTDVPFGRGGSPLQNLIARGVYETKVTALKCVEELDAGPVYLKRPLSLHGAAEEIYIRAGNVIGGMIEDIVSTEPVPTVQIGEPVLFRRRRPAESSISELESLKQIFDFIRMLDAEGYPKAFIETEHFRFEFERASLKQNEIIADVRIKRKD